MLGFQQREVHNWCEYGAQMRAFISIAAVFLTSAVAAPARAQVQPPLHVEAFGGRSEALPQLKIPPDLRQFVPEGNFLRAIIKTQIVPEGETWLLYDNGEDSFPAIHLDAIRAGKSTKMYDGAVGGFAGLVPFSLQAKKQALAFAYHVAFDCGDTTFVIFAAHRGTYQKIFEHQTSEGRMKIVEDSTAQIEVWSADWNLDPPDESCVWCPHRYRIQSYAWLGGKFKMAGERLTAQPLDTSEIAGKPFTLLPAGRVDSHSSRP
jgi:hypothetical protein